MAPRTAAAAASPLPRALRLCALLLAGSAPLAKASSASSASAASASKASAAGTAQGATRRFWPFDSSSAGLMAVESTDTVEAPIDGVSYDEALPEPAAAPQRPRLQVRRPKKKARSSPAVPGQGGLVVPDEVMTEPLGLSTSDELLAHPKAAKAAKVVEEYDEDLPEGASKPQALPRQVHHRPTRRAALASTQHGVKAHSKGPGQWDTCLKFAAWTKSQNLQGPEVAAVWLNTCQPAVASGSATKQYNVMCESLGAAIEEFSHNPEWTPKQACTSILRAFRESGVGATPLSP